MAESQIDAATLLILDLSDLQKKCAKKMEHLATEIASSRLIPIFGRLFSKNAPDHISENEEITKALRIASKKTAKRGIRVMDRGGDLGYLYKYLLHEKLKFIIRLRADRTLVANGEASALRVFGIPNFRLYALADGIKRFLFNPSKELGLSPPPSEPRFVQRLLFDS